MYDGEQSQLTGSKKDIDFQTKTKVLHSYWEGFHDSHSTIKEYYISIGTCPHCEDILPEQATGIAHGGYMYILFTLYLSYLAFQILK